MPELHDDTEAAYEGDVALLAASDSSLPSVISVVPLGPVAQFGWCRACSDAKVSILVEWEDFSE
jgi:hypothetical protein